MSPLNSSAGLNSSADPADLSLSHTLSLEATPLSADIVVLERGLYAFEEQRLGSPEHQHFSIFLRDPQRRICGGADVHIMWRRLFIKTLWVESDLRGKGQGRRLMDAIETEADRRKCRSLWLTALGPPARDFYLRFSYRIVGAIDDYVAENALYTMEKRLE